MVKVRSDEYLRSTIEPGEILAIRTENHGPAFFTRNTRKGIDWIVTWRSSIHRYTRGAAN